MQNASPKREFVLRWWAFVKERFSPVLYIPMIIFYFTANAAIALVSAGVTVRVFKEIAGIVVIFWVFLHLRIFDEIKDYEKDLTVHPERPLPRGLISIPEAKKMAVSVILVEIVLSLIIGLPSLVASGCVIGYSLLMYKEFFVREWLRPRLAIYAFTHTAISCCMSLFIYSAVTGHYFWQASKEYGTFLLANMMMFNIFEFGRKTFGREEEKEMIESYSKMLGPFGAAASVSFMAVTAIFIALWLGHVFGAGILFSILMGGLLGFTLMSSLLYAMSNNAVWAKVFRGVSALFIFLFTVIVTVGFHSR